MPRFSCASVLVILLVAGLAAEAARAGTPVDFNQQIRPLLSKRCFACHGPDEEHREGGLRLDRRSAAIAPAESGETAVTPGQPEASELLARISTHDADLRMPPEGEPLSAAEIEQIKTWISQGAEYAEHWAFVGPVRPKLPAVSNSEWPRNAIDHFVLARLDAEHLSPAPTADRHTLARRVSFDLRGLPPTPEEIARFVNDDQPQAYERMVDRFLADTAYGERWARVWLDLVRYADSKGYGSDPLRTIWRYRDWVIQALNQNMPYDQFSIEQLAGDLLPQPTLEQRVATAMHRNTMTNTEGGTDDEEFRVAAIKDRVDTTWQIWMGLTMGCAKCHSHKYDPISQTEYYQFFAFFNQTADNDQPNDQPTLAAPTAEYEQQLTEHQQRVAMLKQKLNTLTPELAAKMKQWADARRPQADWTVLSTLGESTTLSRNTVAANAGATAAGSTLGINKDGVVHVKPTSLEQTTLSLTLANPLEKITGLRLELLPSASPAESQPALRSFTVSRGAGAGPQQVVGRYLRIELPGDEKMLSLAEVQVFAGEENIAGKGSAKQSSTGSNGPAHLAIDGNTSGEFHKEKSTTHTAIESNPWWELDLGGAKSIDKIVVWNRTDNDLQNRLAGYRLSVLNGERKVVWSKEPAEFPVVSAAFPLSTDGSIPLQAALSADAASSENLAAALTAAGAKKDIWPSDGKQNTARFLAASTAVLIENSKQLTFTFTFAQGGEQAAAWRFRLWATSSENFARRAETPAKIITLLDASARENTMKDTADATAKITAYFLQTEKSLAPVRQELAKLEKSRPQPPTLPVMEELPQDKQRQSFVMIKGNFLSHGENVSAAAPQAFHPFGDNLPHNRLGAARWLLHIDNPLTARVAVNRMWSRLFGAGIVVTEEDFGTQGDSPTHPELLDWLAVEFMDSGWNMKAILKTIVMSSTYRQAARVSAELAEKDPTNRLFARGPRFRLEAEMLRDQALALSGLLSRKIGGPSVYPPQPEGLWRAAFNGRDRKWATSPGADRYRRGLYTFWRRTIPYPSMATFDAPSRELCSVRRIRTNTPLQAFVALNDPVFVEAAQALARRILKEGGKTTAERARFGLELCLCRPADAGQIGTIVGLYESELAHYQQHTEDANKLATQPLGALSQGMDAAQAAAWTVVANVLLNTDSVLSKP